MVYIPSTIKSQMNLELFCFWADWDVIAVLKGVHTYILLQYPTFESVYFHIFIGKEIVSVHCSVHTKMSINTKEKKILPIISNTPF